MRRLGRTALFVLVVCLWLTLIGRVRLLAVHRTASRTTTWSKFEQTAKTGDLVYFSGKHTDSTVVRGWVNEPLSHIAVVVNLDERNEFPSRGDQHLYLYNADVNRGKRDAVSGRVFAGVQLNDAELTCRTYNGRVYHQPIPRALDKDELDAFWDHLRSNVGRRFERRMWLLAYWCLFGADTCCGNPTWVCSSLAFDLFRRVGRVPSDARWKRPTPLAVGVAVCGAGFFDPVEIIPHQSSPTK